MNTGNFTDVTTLCTTKQNKKNCYCLESSRVDAISVSMCEKKKM